MLRTCVCIFGLLFSFADIALANLFCEESQPFIHDFSALKTSMQHAHEAEPVVLEGQVLKHASGDKFSLQVRASVAREVQLRAYNASFEALINCF